MIDKKVSPKGKSVRVTFQLPADVATSSVAIVGDFNDWQSDKDLMTLDSKKNVWKGSLSLKPGNTHEFRYLVDGSSWLNDEQADGYSATEFFSQNCVLNV